MRPQDGVGDRDQDLVVAGLSTSKVDDEVRSSPPIHRPVVGCQELVDIHTSIIYTSKASPH